MKYIIILKPKHKGKKLSHRHHIFILIQEKNFQIRAPHNVSTIVLESEVFLCISV